MFKKCLAIVMSFVLIACSSGVCAFAVSAEPPYSDYPVILVPGYSGSELDVVNEDGSRERVWHFDNNELVRIIVDEVVANVKAGKTSDEDAKTLSETILGGANALVGGMACNPDGTSKYNVQLAYVTPEETNMAYIHENGLNDEVIGEVDLFNEIAAAVGEENCFFFEKDWRMGAIECARQLDSYIQSVKEFSGKDKVNLIAVSHGGQVTATYLSLYGYKQDVDNAVMTVPACSGAALAYDIMNRSLVIDEYNIVYFLEHGFVSEEDYTWLVEAQSLGFLDAVANEIAGGIIPFINTFTSIWDFMPEEYYEEMKGKLLDPVENAGIIANSDRMHYEIMPNYHESLTKCIEEYGMNISIIAGYGIPAVTGLQESSDGIITTNDATGATCAPYGKRFADGYTGVKTVCSNPAHDHVSPSFEIDATSAWLPENTWFVEELFHGMTFHDDYSRQLALELLLTDNITDVHTRSEYPQFHASTNPCNTIYAEFDSEHQGYVCGDDKFITVTNISQKYPVKITSLTFAGKEFTAHSLGINALAPGESVKIQVTGKLPQVSNQNMQVEINCYCEGRVATPYCERTFNFKIMNGTSVVYDEANPLVDADCVTGFESAVSDETVDILNTWFVGGFVAYFYNMFMAIMEQLGIARFL